VHASILRNHWKVIQKLKVIQTKLTSQIGRGSTNNNFGDIQTDLWMQNSHIR